MKPAKGICIALLALTGCGPSKEEVRLTTEIAARDATLAATIEGKRRAEDEVKTLQVGLKEASEQVHVLQTSLSEAKNNHRSIVEEVARLQEQMAQKGRDVVALEERVRQRDQSLQEARTQLSDLNNRIASLTAARREESERRETEARKPRLSFQAAVQYRNGDTKPVTNTEFYLTKVSLEELVKQSGITVKGPTSWTTEIGGALALARLGQPREVAVADALFFQVRGAALKTWRTDFSGAAQVQDIETGRYYIIGFSPMGRLGVMWSYAITISEGDNRVYVDQDSAVWAH